MGQLSRAIEPMPEDVRRALEAAGLGEAYAARPAYQRNDYLGWFAQAKRPATRQRRIDQMLAELAAGDVYMGMAWRPRRRERDALR